MTILFDSARSVKPGHPFGKGLLPVALRRPYTAADASWWAANAPGNDRNFDVVGPSDADLDFAAGSALAGARLDAGFPLC